MSHQTGITANVDLRNFFATCKDGDIRLVKVGIVEEQLTYLHSEAAVNSWEEDYDNLVLPLLEEKQPCYIFYRLDSKTGNSYDWVYLSYSPDFAPIKQKMLFAATRATLKKEFGGGQIREEVFGTVIEDVSLDGYRKHVLAQHAPAPLTMAEEELEEIKKTETHVNISIDTKHQTMQGVAFPIDSVAYEKLEQLREGQLNYVQLSLDLANERFVLENCDDTNINTLASKIPTDKGRFHVFTYKHTHEGDYMESIVFIYSMPGYKCPIKERMMYSSSKAPLQGLITQQLLIPITKNIEVDDPTELTEEFVYDEIHPKKNVATQKFARPKGPGGRGPRRITKPNANNNN